MPPGLEQALGALLLLLILLDVFLTVLYARAGTGIISYQLARLIWRAFGVASRPFGQGRSTMLSFCGPTILVLLVLVWALVLTLGGAMILHPQLGRAIQADSGATPTDFVTAMYVAANSMSIVGSSGFSPKSEGTRLLFLYFSLTGLSVTSLTLTYLMQVYAALQRRNALGFAIELMSAETADAAELLAGCGPRGQFNSGYTNLSSLAAAMTEVKESHHFYPVLFYFRFREASYSVSRICFMALDTVTLIKSTLDDEHGAWLKESASVSQLARASLRLLTTLEETFLGGAPDQLGLPDAATQERWRRRYSAALHRLREAGIATTADEAAGAEHYVKLRAGWNGHIERLAPAMGYDREEIDHAAVDPAPERQVLRGHLHSVR